jgi:endonuclease G
VVLVIPEGGEKDDVEKVFARTRVIAVVMPNSESVHHDWAKYRTSVRKVEELTGYAFFDKVPADVIGPLKERVDDVQVRPARARGRGGKSED